MTDQDVACTAVFKVELAQAVHESEISEIVWQALICAYLDHEGWRSLAEAVFEKHGYTLDEIRRYNDDAVTDRPPTAHPS